MLIYNVWIAKKVNIFVCNSNVVNGYQIKCFNITSYSFLFTRKFKDYLFSKAVLIYQEKAPQRSIYFPENFDGGVDNSPRNTCWGVIIKRVYVYGDTGSQLGYIYEMFKPSLCRYSTGSQMASNPSKHLPVQSEE